MIIELSLYDEEIYRRLRGKFSFQPSYEYHYIGYTVPFPNPLSGKYHISICRKYDEIFPDTQHLILVDGETDEEIIKLVNKKLMLVIMDELSNVARKMKIEYLEAKIAYLKME
jgi:hypothetical protein